MDHPVGSAAARSWVSGFFGARMTAMNDAVEAMKRPWPLEQVPDGHAAERRHRQAAELARRWTLPEERDIRRVYLDDLRGKGRVVL